jgi:hypothetical protein
LLRACGNDPDRTFIKNSTSVSDVTKGVLAKNIVVTASSRQSQYYGRSVASAFVDEEPVSFDMEFPEREESSFKPMITIPCGEQFGVIAPEGIDDTEQLLHVAVFCFTSLNVFEKSGRVSESRHW